MLGNISGWHAVILVAVILLLFGATRLPALARSMGQSARIFRSEVKQLAPDKDAVTVAAASEAVVRPTAASDIAAVPADGAQRDR